MLSRIAESLFWIGRYVERADGTARILDVHLERLNGAEPHKHEAMNRELIATMGFPPTEHAQLSTLLEVLAYAPASQNSVTGALGAARENARRARETVSSSVWEALNATWHGLQQPRKDVVGTYRFCAWVQERTAMIRGLTDSTMSHDEAWLFLELGRQIERADMTARLLEIRESELMGLSWMNLLRSAGAYESFLRTQHSAVSEDRAAEFLLLDPLFPRSVFRALRGAELTLQKLDPGAERQIGVLNRARRLIGGIRSRLEYATVDDLVADLPAVLRLVQHTCSQASDAVTKKYFAQGQQMSWVGGLA